MLAHRTEKPLMKKHFLKKLIITVNPWHFVWISIIFSEIFTALLNALLSFTWWGKISHDLLKIGTIDAFIVSLLASVMVIYFVNQIRQTRMINEQLQKEINDRKRIEAALENAKNEWEDTFNTINDAITIHDTDFKLLHANKAAKKLLDTPRQYILKQQYYESFHGIPSPATGHSDHRSSGKDLPAVTEIFEPLLNKYYEIKTFPRQDKDARHTGFIYVARDITQNKKSEQEQQKLMAQLLQAQKMESIGRLAGGVAHDFNNILSLIIGYSSIILDELSDDSPIKDDMKLILNSGERAAALTRQLLAFSRKQILDMKLTNINSLIEDMTMMLGRVIGEDITLKLNMNSTAKNVLADPSQIEQVLMNLAINARDAMPDGGRIVIETSSIELGGGFAGSHEEIRPGVYTLISVSDTGTGISSDVQKKIFEPFFTTKEVGKGTGLGLATVYGIIKQHQGYIYVDSKINQGTKFRIYLPVVQEEAERIKKKINKSKPKGTETVLVVEDEPSLRKLIVDMLRQLGYKTLEAPNGETALQIGSSHQETIHLLLTDVIMPGMKGNELAEALKADRQEMKVIFMSGYADDMIAHHGVLDPGLHFIQKPLPPSKLARKIRDVLDA